MRLSPLLAGLTCALLLTTGSIAAPAPDSPRLTPVVRAVNATAPAVVNITSTHIIEGQRFSPLEQFFGFGEDPFAPSLGPRRQKRVSLGSGVIVDGSRGLVLTNAHVIAGGDDVMVRLQDGREFAASVKGADPDFDIAVLELRGAHNLPSVRMADSSDIMPGETAIAIGNPFGYNHTVTVGVISAMGRTIRSEDAVLTDLLQTDAAINPGNSGGPLLNLEGQLIGINTAVSAKGEGIGFAIPVNKARRVMDNLLHGGKVSPLWLGLSGEDMDQRIAMALGLKEARGLLVTAIFNGGPAQQAGMEPGDVILEINKSAVDDRRDYLTILRNQLPGEPLTLRVARGDRELRLSMTPVPFDNETALRMMESRWGLSLQGTRGGVAVVQVRRDGPASFLRRGDIIVGVGGTRTATLEALIDAFRRERMAKQVLLHVIRNGREYYARLIVR